jgi:hypothetical protein
MTENRASGTQLKVASVSLNDIRVQGFGAQEGHTQSDYAFFAQGSHLNKEEAGSPSRRRATLAGCCF